MAKTHLVEKFCAGCGTKIGDVESETIGQSMVYGQCEKCEKETFRSGPREEAPAATTVAAATPTLKPPARPAASAPAGLKTWEEWQKENPGKKFADYLAYKHKFVAK